MSSAAHAGRIPETAFKVCLGLFLGVSVLAVAARTTIRVKTRHALFADDVFLFLGVACVCVAIGLAYPIISEVYLQEAINTDPKDYTLPLNDLPKLLEDLKINVIFIVFAWTAEFLVKISLLLFFIQLVRRLPRLTLYVKFVMGFATTVWIVLISEPFITCHYFGLSTLTKCTPPNIPLVVALTILINILDVITDIMILSIPIMVLWKASMSIKQKVGLGAFLTVNIWLIIVAVVRVSIVREGKQPDLTWQLFFQCFEPNVAILAACFSAFRSLFVNNGSKARIKHDRPTYSLRDRLFRRSPHGHQELDDLPSIPGATLKGMRTMTWQRSTTKIGSSDGNASTMDPDVGEDIGQRISEHGLSDHPSNITVKRDWSIESTRISSRDRASDKQLV